MGRIGLILTAAVSGRLLVKAALITAATMVISILLATTAAAQGAPPSCEPWTWDWFWSFSARWWYWQYWRWCWHPLEGWFVVWDGWGWWTP